MAAKRKKPAPKPAPPVETWIVLANGQEIEVTGTLVDVTDNGTLVFVDREGPLKVFAHGAWSTVTLKPEPGAVMAGLLDEYLTDLLYGTRTTNVPFNAGLLSGSFGEQRSAMPKSGYEPPTDDAMRMGGVMARHGIGPFTGSLGVNATTGPEGTMVAPGAGAGIGPVSLNAALMHQSDAAGSTTRPAFGATLAGPLGEGTASLTGSVTPGLVKQLAAQFNLPLDAASELAFQLIHTRPNEGVPDTRAGIAYRRRF